MSLNVPTPFSFSVITSSAIGTILEWYDFSLFAFLTPILATKFFPQENQFTGLILTYSIFAIGFIARPIGAALFGHLGDRAGRKKALVYSILLMTIPTFLIGLLPTYHQIGLAAPLLLMVLRLCQGLSAGGESTGAVLFVMEKYVDNRRGFIGGILWAVVGLGILLGSFAGMLVTAYSTYSWAWRIPFLLGILTGIIGYFVRKKIPESSEFQQMANQGLLVKYPLFSGFLKHKIATFRIMGVYALSAMITYLVFIFMPNFAADKIIGLPLYEVTLISTLALTSLTFLVPFGGYLSDFVGRKNTLRWSAIGFLMLSYPLFCLISKGSLTLFIFAECIFVLLAACYQGTINAFVVEQVPTSVRFSLIAVGYNISYSIFGGTAPIIASYLVQLTGDKASPGLYLLLGACLALLSTLKITGDVSDATMGNPLTKEQVLPCNKHGIIRS